MDKLEKRIVIIEQQIADIKKRLQELTKISYENEKGNLEGFKLMNTAFQNIATELIAPIALEIDIIKSQLDQQHTL